MNREQVMERIGSICDLKVKPITHGPKTKVSVGSDMVVLKPGGGARTLEMTEEGVRNLANFCTIPDKFGTTLTPTTFGLVATELLEAKGQYALIVDRDNRIVDFGRAKEYRDFNTERVLATIDRAMPSCEIQRVFSLADHTVSLDVASPKEMVVSRGDLVRAGANITFSPIGVTTPLVVPYTLRCECTNGMTTSDILREYKFTGGDGGGGGSFYPWLNKSIRLASNCLGDIIKRWRKLQAENIPDGQRAAMLTALLREARITGEVAAAINSRALEHPPENSFDLFNLITWGASTVEMEPKEVFRLRGAADKSYQEEAQKRLCSLCHNKD